MKRTWSRPALWIAPALVAVTLLARPAHARMDPQMLDEFVRSHPEYFGSRSTPGAANGAGQIVRGPATPAALPDILGPGAVLTAGDVNVKVTNLALIGNPFLQLSSDPSGQWPGASGVEYLGFVALSVGAVNPVATDPNAVRRVSYFNEWRPPTLQEVDHIYRSYEGIVNGARLVNDDGDRDPLTGEQRIDEEFLDGHDDDGDGRIDEDYAAIGQQMFTCVMRDDTPEGLNNGANESHVPLGLEMRQRAFSFSNPRLANFVAFEYRITNRSGHELDSLLVGFRVDMDCGPRSVPGYWADDSDHSPFPNGDFVVALRSGDFRRQLPHLPVNPPVPEDSALCPRVTYRLNGFSVMDEDGDAGRTLGIASFLLLGHTIDPLGVNAPSRVQFRAFRSYSAGAPFENGGNPNTDQQRFDFLSSTQDVDPETGHLVTEPSELSGDWQAWCSIGPFLHVANGASVEVTVAFAVQRGEHLRLNDYPSDLARYQVGSLDGGDLLEKYPALDNALTAQIAYEGVYERPREGFESLVPSGANNAPFHGRETPLRARPGQLGLSAADCHDLADGQVRPITEFELSWFDFDCDYCTGAYEHNDVHPTGLFLKRWNVESPPPSPSLNVAANFNYTDNPDRQGLEPSGDHQITLAWDNLSEATPDPERHEFDFRTFRVWKAADWQRPVVSSGPADSDWALLGEFRMFDYVDSNFVGETSLTNCPNVLFPAYLDPVTGTRAPRLAPLCLRRGDLWNPQSGEILRPTGIDCVRDTFGRCLEEDGVDLVTQLATVRTKYPVGRYRYVDREVKNGFVYFYSISAGDSSSSGETFGRRSAQEADAVSPQTTIGTGKQVWVVPNPYRGVRTIGERASAWDLTPSATDPTGTHIDFFGMPAGRWTIRIFTISGDLVVELHSDDAVNASLRNQVQNPNGQVYDGANRQQDGPNDGQARWNLISRNGQDIVSGIYLFVVDSSLGTQRGRFVVIR